MKILKPLLFATLLGASLAQAAPPAVDRYPERAITLVVPWPPGGFTDKLGRLIGEKMAARLGQPVVIDNRPGASGGIGVELVMHAAPDGYNLVVTSTDSTVRLLQKKGFDPANELTQIGMLASQPVTLSVGPRFKGTTLADFVKAARAEPEKLTFASNGEGGATHYGMEIFAKQAGIRLTHIPYKGTAPALNDLLSGEVDATLVSLQGVGPLLEGGRLRALAITSARRQPSAPAVPTFAETGYPGFDLQLWYGLVGPKGMPEPLVRKLNEAMRAALALPEVQQQLRAAAAEPLGGSPEDMQAFVKKETVRWTAMIP